MKSFVPHKYRSHHDGQHAESWALIKAAVKEDKQHFFDNKIKVTNTLHQYMDLDNDILTFMINASIVNMIIGDMFFRDDKVIVDSDDADDDDVVGTVARKAAKKLKEKTNAMKLFIFNEVNEDEDDPHSYTVTIKNIMQFNLAMDHVRNGMSFRQTANAIEHTKEHTKTAKLTGISDLMSANTSASWSAPRCSRSLIVLMTNLSGQCRWRATVACTVASRSSTCAFAFAFVVGFLVCTWSIFPCSIATRPAISLTCWSSFSTRCTANGAPN